MRTTVMNAPGGDRSRAACLTWRLGIGGLAPLLLLGACASQPPPPPPVAGAQVAPVIAVAPIVDPKYGVAASPRVIASPGQRVPSGGGVFKIGKPYQVAGRWYVPREEPGYDRSGTASWYGADFHGRKTANGEIFDMEGLSAAHPTLPLPSYVLVTNLANDRTVMVRVNDRGPYVHGRIIDLSRGAARELGFERMGIGQVRVKYYARAPLEGDTSFERAYLAAQPWRSGITGVQQQAARRPPLPLAAMAAPPALGLGVQRAAPPATPAR